ncbi:MAG: TetR/AcrR family transcriptional regulator, partial [Desulfarculus sp.]
MRASADTKHQIMVAAEKVMSQKGLKDSTISEIASLASINDSVIYHYFKNKEDLLFSIEGDHLLKVLKMLNEQLVGIPEAMSRLSKMVWFHLNYNLTNRDYSKLLIFECRSNINFYKHEAYNLIRRYAKIMLGILDDGVQEGVFRDDVDTYLMRDLILGATDWITIRRIVQEDFSDVMPEVQRFMALVRMMVKVPAPGLPAKNDKHARILAAAEKAFSQRGYSAATIAEIARLAGVAEGTIYEYFTNKQDLLMSI